MLQFFEWRFTAMKIYDYLEINENDLPCYCRVSNISRNYTLKHGEKRTVIGIVVEPYFKDIYPHNQEMVDYMEESKDTHIRRALTDDGKLYDHAIKE